MNESPQRLTKFICSFCKCHSVCSNIWEVSFVTTLLLLMPLTWKWFRWIRLWTSCSLSHKGQNKQAADHEKIHSFPSLKLSKHEIVWKQHTTFLNRARDDSIRYAVTKVFFALKKENWYYLEYNCNCPLRQEFRSARMNLNSRTDCITLDNARAHTSYMLFYHKEKHLMFVYSCVWNVSFT